MHSKLRKGSKGKTLPQSLDTAESLSIEKTAGLLSCAQDPEVAAKCQRTSSMQVTADGTHFTSAAVIPKWCLKSLWRYHKANGWQVCVRSCVECLWQRERERGRVRDPSFWQIRFKDLPHEMLHRRGYRSVFSCRENGHGDGWKLCNESVCLGRESMLYYFWLIKQSELAISPARTSHGWLHIIHRD